MKIDRLITNRFCHPQFDQFDQLFRVVKLRKNCLAFLERGVIEQKTNLNGELLLPGDELFKPSPYIFAWGWPTLLQPRRWQRDLILDCEFYKTENVGKDYLN